MQNLLWRGPDVFACAITYETADGNFAVLRLEWNGSEAHEEVREKLIEARNAEPQVVKPVRARSALFFPEARAQGDAVCADRRGGPRCWWRRMGQGREMPE